jgi:hypothetical protein
MVGSQVERDFVIEGLALETNFEIAGNFALDGLLRAECDCRSDRCSRNSPVITTF